jgi:HD-GYP domain-containing protein (c-di-GMP phosphodiesterase class II)
VKNKESSDLIPAYDAILEKWAMAIEQRGREAQGHTRRVVEMTLTLAKSMGVNDQELEQIRRGVLLHDIGNMTVSENILHKQGELTVEEWITIHMHPFNAYEMFESIDYLIPALDIPYCHHERWDGTGYPRGLKGERIPLAARIFAIVDVWDALTSDRPFRKAWPKKKALDYIREQSGKHFDPPVVEAFLEMLSEEEHDE